MVVLILRDFCSVILCKICLTYLGPVWRGSYWLRLLYRYSTVVEPGGTSKLQLLWLLSCLCRSQSPLFVRYSSLQYRTVRNSELGARARPCKSANKWGLSFALFDKIYFIFISFYWLNSSVVCWKLSFTYIITVIYEYWLLSRHHSKPTFVSTLSSAVS